MHTVTTLLSSLGGKVDALKDDLHKVQMASATSTRVDNIRMALETEREERHKLEARIATDNEAIRIKAEVEIAKIRSFVWTIGVIWVALVVIIGALWALFTYFRPHP